MRKSAEYPLEVIFIDANKPFNPAEIIE